ncbi:MAG: hypothetical protein JJU26_08050 [Oceanicaulis sp.]|uniref:hypothetical protein n=1 Tax=Glycocaulis sp. TaxID=1969725 RepID=UPI0025B902F6|nr:hypothetical protein [Glycocaulis sp.]MCC5981654.1 hypothetical protein [Oceanicaulis sp.]MCH8520753.1 hypothetical protein [Glycocaulis sp.]
MFQLPINPRAPVARLTDSEARLFIEQNQPPASVTPMSDVCRMLWRRRRAKRYG